MRTRGKVAVPPAGCASLVPAAPDALLHGACSPARPARRLEAQALDRLQRRLALEPLPPF